MGAARPKRRAAQKVTTYNEAEAAEEEEMAPKMKKCGPTPTGAVKDDDSRIRTNETFNKISIRTNGLYAATKAEVANNWQPPLKKKFPRLLNLGKCRFTDDKRSIICSDKTVISKDDHIYMVLEPAGEPYYIARVMGFQRKRSLKSNANTDAVENYQIKVNWYYRPRDILRQSSDTRVLYATMHSDLCPVSSFRGKVRVTHRDEIDDLVAYRSKPEHFWYDKLFDRYMIKFYDILPTRKLTKLPHHYQQALVKRFAYVFVESGRGDDLLVTPKNCVKCNQWCSVADSVECAKCSNWYHMLCLSPPLVKKPSRGYSWSCARCSKALDDEMRRGHDMSYKSDAVDAYEEDAPVAAQMPLFEQLAVEFLEHDKHLTLEQRRAGEEWPFRYLGMHARLEDALDLEDRPYPRASSRLGTKHQATICEWPGRPEIYYDPDVVDGAPASKRRTKGKKKHLHKTGSESVEPTAQKRLQLADEYKGLSPKQLPPWVKPRPAGYIERGLDDGSSSTLMWKQPPKDSSFYNQIDFFVFKKCRPVAKELKIFPNTPNFLDAVFKTLLDTNFDFDRSFDIIRSFTRTLLKEPTFTPEEVARFEEGVRRHGSELLPVSRHVATQPFGMVVRFYYLWKKTPNGHLIWDNFAGRRNKKVKKNTKSSDYVDSIADPDDDSSYDNETSAKQRRSYLCKHCNIASSPKWFRAPGFPVAPSDPKETVTALCIRCALLWRLYAVVWEDPYEVAKKINQKGGNVWKKKVEHALAQDALQILAEKDRCKLLSKPKKKASSSLSSSSSPAPDEIVIKKKNVKNGTIKTPSKPKKVKEIKVKKEETTSLSPNVSTVGKSERLVGKSESMVGKSEPKKLVLGMGGKPDDSEPLDMVDDAVHYTYNRNYTYNFDNFDRKTHEFDNPLPEPKDDYTIPLSPKTKSANSKDSPGIKQIISSSGLFPPNKRPCCVCRTCRAEDVDEVLICSNCGLNVHATCYGVPAAPGVKMYTKEWCCDSCSNDLHPVASTYYGCSLCYSKEIDHDSAIIGCATAFPDALKRTSNFKWAHVLCSVFGPDIKFEDAQTMQGVINIPVTLVKNEHVFCDICNIKSGLLKQCLLCESKQHVTCAQDSDGYFIGFRIIPELEYEDYPDIFDSTRPRKLVQIAASGMVGIPEPVVVCANHEPAKLAARHDIFGCREKARFLSNDTSSSSVLDAPLIKLYVEGYMQWQGGYRGTALRYYETVVLKEQVRKREHEVNIDLHSRDVKVSEPSMSLRDSVTPHSSRISFSFDQKPVNQCSKVCDCSTYCGILSTDNWWQVDTDTSATCLFCTAKDTDKSAHFKDLENIDLSGSLYGV